MSWLGAITSGFMEGTVQEEFTFSGNPVFLTFGGEMSWLAAATSGFAGGFVSGTSSTYNREPAGGSNPPKQWQTTAQKTQEAADNQVSTWSHPHIHVDPPEFPKDPAPFDKMA